RAVYLDLALREDVQRRVQLVLHDELRARLHRHLHEAGTDGAALGIGERGEYGTAAQPIHALAADRNVEFVRRDVAAFHKQFAQRPRVLTPFHGLPLAPYRVLQYGPRAD